MKDLIFTQCHLTHAIHGRLMRTCLELVERLNPGVDVLLIDNASALDPTPYLPWTGDIWRTPLPDRGCWPGDACALGPGHTVGRFDRSLGHFNHDKHRQPPPQDGPGRAISTALSIAMASGYDRAVYIESDCLCFKSIAWGFDQLATVGKKVGFQPRLPVGYLDNNVWWFSDLKWLRHVGAVERYDWPNRKGDFTGEPTGEQIWEEIFKDDLAILPMRGGRGTMCDFYSSNIREKFPDGIDYCTHLNRRGFATALEMMGHGDLAPYLMGE